MKKILVIEDEEPLRANILELLEAEEFVGIGAENGIVGVRLAKKHQPDLILCDVMMPELDGYGVLSALRQDQATAVIPFIFLTAKAGKTDLRQGMELGADDYLAKPFTPTQLLGAIATRLAKQSEVEKHSQKKLEQLRNSITLSLPHELLTPLSTILCSSEILIDKQDLIKSEQMQEMAELIHTSAERLHKLIQNFLLYARLEIAATDPERVKTFQSSLITYPEIVIRDIALQKAKQVDREADLSLSLQAAKVRISATNLKKIVEELLDNAFKYSLPQTPVHVSCYPGKHTFTLCVSDQGRGITADQIARLGAYVQFERKLYEQQGSGLGLFIAKRLAEIHAGKLSIESIPGKQTTVRVDLPT